MKQLYPNNYLKFVIVMLAFTVMNFAALGQKVFSPATNSSFTGGGTYCQNASAAVLIYTYNTCNIGTGSSSGTFITIKWFSNSTNATTGGTLVSTTLVHCALTATGNSIYQPATSVPGTLYYYCQITWDGSGTCNTGGVLTSSTTAVNVTAQPDAITGNTAGCAGTVTALANTVAGGTWTSSNTTVATMSATGGVNCVATGTATISYSIGSCRSTTSFTVISSVPAITGTNSICEGAITTFACTQAGGTWSTDNSSVAAIDGSSPVHVGGVAAGSTTISYSFSSGCYATRGITVNTAPAAITGTSTACAGTLTTLSNSVAGGTWTSGTPAKATISTSGVVGAVAAGTSTISYTIGSCRSTLLYTVNATPVAITGASSFCQGTSVTFSDATASGTWSTANASVATVNTSSPVTVTGNSFGSTTISYTLPTGCYVTKPVTVSTSPGPITGNTSACTGTITTLSNAVSGGIWSSATTARATITTSGAVSAVSNGTSVISYAIGSCASSVTFTSIAPPATIGGATTNICQGTTRTYTNTITGGLWSSSNTAVATVTAAGVVTAVTPGTITLTYSTGCGTSATRVATTNATPAAITGTTDMCTGTTVTLANTVSGGTWTSSNTTAASINATTGAVNPLSAGTSSITYAIGPCAVGQAVTVNTQPGAISGISFMCTPAATSFTNATAGGIWSSSNMAAATVDAATGMVYGIATGNATITYANATCIATKALTTSARPTAAITMAQDACAGYPTNIIFTGTPGAILRYRVDGGSALSQTLTGTTLTISTGIITSTHSYNLIDIHDATCSSTIDTTANVSPIIMQWTGGAAGHETEWHNAANWSCGFVPDSTSDVTIPATSIYTPVVAGTETVKSLICMTDAVINSNSGATLRVKTALINNGTFAGNGTLSSAGTLLQTISGTGRVSNFALNNNAGACISAASRMVITNTFTIINGSFATNDSLVLSADSSATAIIPAIPTGSTITGKVTVKEYIQGGYRRYRFFSHPFSNAISLNQLASGIDITGAGGSANGFTTTSSNAASAFRFDPYTSNSTLGYDPGWKPYTKISNVAADTNLFKKYQGLRVFCRGSRGQGLGYIFIYAPDAATITMTGNVNQGTQLVPLSKGTDSTQDYNMVGNPYPSPVDIGSILYNAKQAGKITGGAFYVWNPTIGAGGQYLTIPIGTSAPIPYSIQSYTSFQVRAAFDGAQLSFTERNKTANYNTALLKMQNTTTSLTIYDTSYHTWDMLSIQYNDAATNAEDNNYDAVKVLGTDFTFYSLSEEGRKLAIDARPFSTGNTIPLGITSAYARDFIIRADNVAVPDGSTLYLHDKLLQKYVALQAGTEYRFSITKEKESQGNDRFELSARPDNTATTTGNLQVALTPNPATEEVNIAFHTDNSEKVCVRVTDYTGVNVYSKDMGAVSTGTVKIPLNNLAAGIYIVEVISGTQKTISKLVKE